MGKKSTKKGAAARSSPLQPMRVQVLGARMKKSKEQTRFERATESAVESLAMRNLPFQELADAIRNRMNEMLLCFLHTPGRKKECKKQVISPPALLRKYEASLHSPLHRILSIADEHGPEWHCMVGKDFLVNVRYWRAKCFVFEDGDMKIMVFQSAPPSPEAALLCVGKTPLREEKEGEAQKDGDASSGKSGISGSVERTSAKVLRSEMEQAYQNRVLEMAGAAAKSVGQAENVAGIVSAIKTSLTEATGPVWHAVGTKGGGDWGCAVAHEEGHLLDFKLNGHRFVVWKHAQSPSIASGLTAKRVSSSLFVLTFLVLCLYIKIQSSCDVCCSSKPKGRWKARCEGVDPVGDLGESGVECLGDAISSADRCLRNATVLFYLTCGTLACATTLRWTDRENRRHKYQVVR